MTPDQATELKNLTVWRELLKEIDKMIEFEVGKLVVCEENELKSIQEKIKAYHSIARIPQNVIDREEGSAT